MAIGGNGKGRGGRPPCWQRAWRCAGRSLCRPAWPWRFPSAESPPDGWRPGYRWPPDVDGKHFNEGAIPVAFTCKNSPHTLARCYIQAMTLRLYFAVAASLANRHGMNGYRPPFPPLLPPSFCHLWWSKSTLAADATKQQNRPSSPSPHHPLNKRC